MRKNSGSAASICRTPRNSEPHVLLHAAGDMCVTMKGFSAHLLTRQVMVVSRAVLLLWGTSGWRGHVPPTVTPLLHHFSSLNLSSFFLFVRREGGLAKEGLSAENPQCPLFTGSWPPSGALLSTHSVGEPGPHKHLGSVTRREDFWTMAGDPTMCRTKSAQRRARGASSREAGCSFGSPLERVTTWPFHLVVLPGPGAGAERWLEAFADRPEGLA